MNYEEDFELFTKHYMNVTKNLTLEDTLRAYNKFVSKTKLTPTDEWLLESQLEDIYFCHLERFKTKFMKRHMNILTSKEQVLDIFVNMIDEYAFPEEWFLSTQFTTFEKKTKKIVTKRFKVFIEFIETQNIHLPLEIQDMIIEQLL